jgi:hypothetical protein
MLPLPAVATAATALIRRRETTKDMPTFVVKSE